MIFGQHQGIALQASWIVILRNHGIAFVIDAAVAIGLTQIILGKLPVLAGAHSTICHRTLHCKQGTARRELGWVLSLLP